MCTQRYIARMPVTARVCCTYIIVTVTLHPVTNNYYSHAINIIKVTCYVGCRLLHTMKFKSMTCNEILHMRLSNQIRRCDLVAIRKENIKIWLQVRARIPLDNLFVLLLNAAR